MAPRSCHPNRAERGFTLVELLATLLLMSILAAFAVGAGRNFWWRQALNSSEGDVAFALRALQQQAVAESNPLVYGARFSQNSSSFETYRYNPLSGTCVSTGERDLSAGVLVADAEFDVYNIPSTSTPVSTLCPGPSTPERYVFFFARGSATDGEVRLRQPKVSAPNTRTVEVIGLTGRVETSG